MITAFLYDSMYETLYVCVCVCVCKTNSWKDCHQNTDASSFRSRISSNLSFILDNFTHYVFYNEQILNNI
jgi:hypothetical protein